MDQKQKSNFRHSYEPVYVSFASIQVKILNIKSTTICRLSLWKHKVSLCWCCLSLRAGSYEETIGPALSSPPPPPTPPGFTEVERTVISSILEKHRLKDVSREIEFNWEFPTQPTQPPPSNNMNVLFELFKQIPERAQLIMDRDAAACKPPPPQPHYIQLGVHHQDPHLINVQQMTAFRGGWPSGVSVGSRHNSSSVSHRPFSVYTRLLRNRSGNIINRIFSARRSKPKLQHINKASAEMLNSNCISIGIQTMQGDEEDKNCDQETSDQSDDAIIETSQKQVFEELFLDESEQLADLENDLKEIKLNSGNYYDVSESDIEVEDDASSDDEDIITIRKPDSEIPVLSPTINSLFPEIPPFIRFVKDNEEGPNADWIGCFGRHIPSVLFRQLKDYQKLNHIPGSFELGRKDQLTKNLNKLRNRFCGEAYNFYPTTFLLPLEYSILKTSCRLSFNHKKRGNCTWIIKPPASSRGRGIYLVSKLVDIPKRKKAIAQKYISDPYLINGNKFDLRIYVYVTSVDPLRIYVHQNGLVRFASQKSLDELWRYLKAKGHDTKRLWEGIKAIAFKTIAAGTFKMASMVAQHVRRREIIHEIFGFDIILDSKLRPWLLEVNISPSLHTSSKVDNEIKSEVIVDLLNLAGFRLPPKEEPKNIRCIQSSRRDFYERRQSELTYRPSTSMDERKVEDQNLPFHKADQLRYILTDAERAKHRSYSASTQFSPDIKTIMDEPTTDDVLMLTTTVNEWYRASLGRFERIYPQRSQEAAKMLNLIHMECDRLTQSHRSFGYYDALIFQFIQRFGTNKNSSVEKRNSSLNYPRQLGGQDVHILSSTLGISVKGLMFVAKLSEK
ncbi:hypothetical protein ACTXT7_012409 [Hymenolepis weldensis]